MTRGTSGGGTGPEGGPAKHPPAPSPDQSPPLWRGTPLRDARRFGAVASALRRVHEASLALVLGTPAERGAAARSKAIAFARSRHRRDRVVAWLCEFRNLNAFDRSLAGRVEEARSADATIASRAMEELLALCYVLLADADVWVRLGGEPMASSALTSLAAAAGAACRHDPRLAWRALPLFLRALRSPHPELRGGAAEALCDDTFASAASALLFHRHDVGLRKPRAWELRRFIDVTFEDPTLLAAQRMPGTGLTHYRQLDMAYRAECVVPWRVIVRAKARALVEMEGASVGSGVYEKHGRDAPGGEKDGALALHLALRSMDPTGETLGSTPLAAVGKRIVTSETVSATAIRTQVRRAKAARAITRRGDDDDDATGRRARRKNGDDSDDDVEDDDIERMNEDQLSNFNPLVLMRRAHEEDEATHLRTPLESTLASIRRFKPAAPITGDEDPNGRNLAHRACLYFGASAAMRRKRRSHDAERIRRAREVLELLLDAALGGRGDQLLDRPPPVTEGAPNARGNHRSGTRTRYPRARGGGGRGDDSGGRDDGEETRPAELPAHGAAAAIHAVSKFVVRSGGGPALIRSARRLAAALRASGGHDRPAQVGLPRGRDAARPRAAAAPAREAPSAARPRVREIGRGKRSAGERLRRGKAGHGSFGDARAGPDGPRARACMDDRGDASEAAVDDRARLARRGEPFSGRRRFQKRRQPPRTAAEAQGASRVRRGARGGSRVHRHRRARSAGAAPRLDPGRPRRRGGGARQARRVVGRGGGDVRG